MLTWLSEILKGVKPDEEGKINFEDVQNHVEAEMLKHMVPKDTYEAVKKERDTAQTKYESVKGANLAELQEQLNKEKAGRKADKLEWKTKAKLEKMGAADPDYLLYKLGDPAELFDDKGNFKDEKAFEDKIKADFPKQLPQGGNGNDNNGGNGGNGDDGSGYEPRGGNPGGETNLGDLDMDAYIKARSSGNK